jgi:acetyl-CoA synthetase
MLMKYGDDVVKKHDLSSLELLGSVGEAINPEAWEWYYRVIGGERCPIVDTWWQTETGGTMISPTPGIELVPLKPGSATFPLPGVNADIFDESGKSVPAGEKGYLVIKSPWPGMLMGVYGDPERYQETYWSKFPGMYYTGDYAIRDKDGYFWLLGRADEVLKIAGHRIGTIEIEDAVVSHESIVEAAVASKPDPIKGECIVVFATPKQGVEGTPELKKSIKDHIRKVLGPVATPDEIYFVAKLPKTRSGKIMRRVLKAVASGTSIGDLTTLEDGTSVDEVKKAFEELQKKV